MKQWVKILIALAVAAVILVAVIGITAAVQEKKCRQYEEYVSGATFSGFDSTQTTNHGKVSYFYTLYLYEDRTWVIKFRASRSGDNSTFSKNGTTSFDLTGTAWSVECSGGEYKLFLGGGDWDWQDWSAAKISRYISITDYGDGDIFFKGLRSGYYDFYFNKK